MDKKVLYITEKGRENIRNQINNLEERLSNIRFRKGEAAESGGNAWHDNAEFEDLEHQERMLTGEMQELKYKLNTAIDADKNYDNSEVNIGSTVTIKYLDTGKTAQIEIVGYGEGDPQSGKVSYDSPLGRCVLGAKAGAKKELVFEDNLMIVMVIGVS